MMENAIQRKLIPSGRLLSNSPLVLSACQSQHPWGGKGAQPQGNPGQADGAAWRGLRSRTPLPDTQDNQTRSTTSRAQQGGGARS